MPLGPVLLAALLLGVATAAAPVLSPWADGTAKAWGVSWSCLGAWGRAGGMHACRERLLRALPLPPRPLEAGRRLSWADRPPGEHCWTERRLQRAADERRLRRSRRRLRTSAARWTGPLLPPSTLAVQNTTAAGDGAPVQTDSCGFSVSRGDDWPGAAAAALDMGSPPVNALAMKGCGACFELQCGSGPDNSSAAEAQVRWAVWASGRMGAEHAGMHCRACTRPDRR